MFRSLVAHKPQKLVLKKKKSTAEAATGSVL